MLFYRKNFKRFRESRGLTQEFIAIQLGVSKQAVQQWEDGKSKPRSAKIAKLAKILGISVVDISNILPFDEEKGLIPPASMARAKYVPVISSTQANMFEPAIQPIGNFVSNVASEHALFNRELKSNYFGLKIEGDSMLPILPNGSVILVNGGEYPQANDIVVAKLRDNGLVIKRYLKDPQNSIISLFALEENGKNFNWDYHTDTGFVRWMHPALEATVCFKNYTSPK